MKKDLTAEEARSTISPTSDLFARWLFSAPNIEKYSPKTSCTTARSSCMKTIMTDCSTRTEIPKSSTSSSSTGLR